MVGSMEVAAAMRVYQPLGTAEALERFLADGDPGLDANEVLGA